MYAASKDDYVAVVNSDVTTSLLFYPDRGITSSAIGLLNVNVYDYNQ